MLACCVFHGMLDILFRVWLVLLTLAAHINAGAPFLFFAALVATAVVVAATIHTDAGKGHAHMAPLFGDDPEADPEVDADCANLAGLPLPAVDARAGGDGAELLDGLLAKHGKQAVVASDA